LVDLCGGGMADFSLRNAAPSFGELSYPFGLLANLRNLRIAVGPLENAIDSDLAAPG
jgi:hypothetical protein